MQFKFFVRKYVGPIDKSIFHEANRFKGNNQMAQKQYGQINTMENIFIEFCGEFMFTSIQDCANIDVEKISC